MTAQPIGYSRHERPPGQPGEVRYLTTRTAREWVAPDGWYLGGQYVERSETFGSTTPAVLNELNGDLWIWRDSETKTAGWIKANGWINHFEPGPEWQVRCEHQHTLPWQVCGTEAECTALAKGEPHD